MANKWMNREQKLLRRKKQKAQRRFFNEAQGNKKKLTRYPREHDNDLVEQQYDDNGDVY